MHMNHCYCVHVTETLC